jgi:hypothetical protein
MGKISRLDVYAKGSLVALVIGLPAVASFLITWRITSNLLISIAVSIVVYFISMGFAFKIAKILAKGSNSNNNKDGL